MTRIITKELALKIVEKLKANKISTRNKAHDEYLVEEDGVHIAIIRVRRCSEKDKGHDYIPKDIHVGPNAAKRLGQCPMSRAQYIAHLREIGILDNPAATDGDEVESPENP